MNNATNNANSLPWWDTNISALADANPAPEWWDIHLQRPGMVMVSDDRNPRRRVRRVDEAGVAHRAQRAHTVGTWSFRVAHGGTVNNSYKYLATTDAVVVVVDPEGIAWAFAGEMPANKATFAGAARAACGEACRWWWDGRTPRTSPLALAARAEMIRMANDAREAEGLTRRPG